MIEDFRNNFGRIFRLFRRQPGYAYGVVCTFAIGVAACSSVANLSYLALLRPISFRDSTHLVFIYERHVGDQSVGVAPTSFREWSKNADFLERFAIRHTSDDNVVVRGQAVRLVTTAVTADYFQVLGVSAIKGRTFDHEAEVPGSSKVVVLSHAFWAQYFGSAEDVLGRIIFVNGVPLTVIGVLPPGATDRREQLIVPLALPDAFWQMKDRIFNGVIARLRPDVSPVEASVRLNAFSLEKKEPMDRDWVAHVVPLLAYETQKIRPILMVVLLGAILLFALTCANVSNLVIARRIKRNHEFAIKVALGAPGGKITREVVLETFVLTALGAIAGILCARTGASALVNSGIIAFPSTVDLAIDTKIILASAGVFIGVGLLIAIVSACRVSRCEILAALKQSPAITQISKNDRVSQEYLVALQVAIALSVLTCAVLLGQSVVHLARINVGFQSKECYYLSVYIPGHNPVEFYTRILNRIRALPAVEAAGVTFAMPLTGRVWTSSVQVQDVPLNAANQPSVNLVPASDGYFEAMQMPVLKGRKFDQYDNNQNGRKVAILSTKAARLLFPEASPIGRNIRLASDNETWREVVGLVGDVHAQSLRGEPSAIVYVPFAQSPTAALSIVVRFSGEILGASDLLRKELASAFPDIPAATVARVGSLVQDATRQEQSAKLLYVTFSFGSLLLSTVGIYSIMSYITRQRQREFAIRIALGASYWNICHEVMKQAVRIILIAAAGSLLGIFYLTSISRYLLFGINFTDGVVLAASVIIFTAILLGTAWLPTRSAARADPIATLKVE